MRRDDYPQQIALGLVLSVAALGAVVRAATLELESPQPNQTYQGRVTVRGNLRNSPNRLLKVRITGFDQVHHFLFEPLGNGVTTVDKRAIVDDYFLCKPGTHTVELIAYAVDQPDKPLVQQRVTFTIEKPDKTGFPKIYLRDGDRMLIDLERRFAILAKLRSTNPADQEALQKTADQLHKQRIFCAEQILRNCVYAAAAHARVMDERRTLGCLQTAAQVYERDLPGLVAHPLKGQIEWRHLASTVPYFFDNMANLYARHAQLDKAVEWLQKELEFCGGRRKGLTTAADRRGILMYIASVHRRIANVNLLLADDMEAWKKYNDAAVALDRQANDTSVP